MGFFDDIGRAFQDAGNAINNDIIQPAQITLDPAKNGVTSTFTGAFDPNKNGTVDFFDPNKGNFNNAFDPNKNGVANAFDPNKNGIETSINNELHKIDPKLNLKDIPNEIISLPNKIESQINNELHNIDPKLNLKDIPKIIEDLPNKIETQINVELKKINPRLKLPPKPKIPPPKLYKPTEINDIIKKGFEDTISKPIVSGFEKDIIKPSQKISNDIKTGFEKDIIDGFQTKVIDGFKKDVIDGFQTKVIDGFQKDIISPSKVLFDSIGDGLNNLNQGGSTKNNNINNDGSYDLIIYAGLGLLVAYIVLK